MLLLKTLTATCTDSQFFQGFWVSQPQVSLSLDIAWENGRHFHTFLALCLGLHSSCLSEAVVTACFPCCSLHPYFCWIYLLRSNKQIWLKVIIFCPELPVCLLILYPSIHDYSGSSFLAISVPGSAGCFRVTLQRGISKVSMVHQWHALGGNDCAYKCDQTSNVGCTHSEWWMVKDGEEFLCIYCPAVFPIAKLPATADPQIIF